MKREEWYESEKFKLLRLLNNFSHELIQKTQQLGDLLEVLLAQYGPAGLGASDKFCIAERQLRIVNLESHNLATAMDRLASSLSPKLEDGIEFNQESKT